MGCGSSKKATTSHERLLGVAEKKKAPYVGVIGVAYAQGYGARGPQNLSVGQNRDLFKKSGKQAKGVDQDKALVESGLGATCQRGAAGVSLQDDIVAVNTDVKGQGTVSVLGVFTGLGPAGPRMSEF